MKIVKRILFLPTQLLNFFKLTYAELKKVVWLSRKQTLKYAVIIITSLIVCALIILVLDHLFLFLRNLVI